MMTSWRQRSKDILASEPIEESSETELCQISINRRTQYWFPCWHGNTSGPRRRAGTPLDRMFDNMMYLSKYPIMLLRLRFETLKFTYPKKIKSTSVAWTAFYKEPL
ncbi:hypothetical protein EYF80_025108 [Liparis tanakae]|uniref:Uncharacterized protein n=1 Tax=Liparis tanakae TaxID=230148 RepID=A0A4Z2HGH2_9TELE|nr:hypothetical protein EYF80_025108 [Liparis tanakae]